MGRLQNDVARVLTHSHRQMIGGMGQVEGWPDPEEQFPLISCKGFGAALNGRVVLNWDKRARLSGESHLLYMAQYLAGSNV